MSKINLSRAFTLRKRLRSVVNEITERLRNGSVIVHVSTIYPNDTVLETGDKDFDYKGLNLMDTYKLLLEANEHMVQLNNIIDNANVPEARSIINEIEGEKGIVGVLNNFAEENKNFKESSSKFEPLFEDIVRSTKGGVVTKNYKKACDYDWEKEAADCKKRIISLEDKLSEVNASTIVEIPDEVLKFIENHI